MIRVGLVDDQALIREGIAQLIALSGKAVTAWQCDNGEAALATLRKEPIDVLVCDIRMPGMDGITMVKRLRANGERQPVLMLTTFDDHQLFLDALAAGANGFLLKDVSLDKLIEAIETVAGGGFIAEPRLVSQASTTVKDAPPADPDLLSDKEREVLRLVAGGLSNREIASVIHLAEGTVKNHVSHILTKLNCRDRTQAVLYAIHWQLI
ncbi:DNA-binding response regulator [Halioglobus sp. HI00S01]|uniref:response regulator n=1 Tax=Halioglobus sp. HI00S01 TaxID=1822214 RepID=UPI0007C2EEBA|nr:response regulator transcription factor [Halioglobus sp. HI00S01]KZX58714.1 DNA-binding response regulator [Halioglobus sp. HI00S01]